MEIDFCLWEPEGIHCAQNWPELNLEKLLMCLLLCKLQFYKLPHGLYVAE